MTSQNMTTAREIAYDALIRVMEEGQNPDESIDFVQEKLEKKGPNKQQSKLTRIDRNLAKEIVYGSLRWHSKILWILQNTATRDLSTTTPEVRAALVAGTYQIFYMDRVPDRAAVNESVQYIRKKGQANAVSFVNGILRQIARRAAYFPKPDKKLKPVEYLSLQFAYPQWLVARWFQHFKFDRLEAMLSNSNQHPKWTIRINAKKTELKDAHLLQQNLLKDERNHSDRRPLRTALWLRKSPQIEAPSLFADGFYTIQDESSQLIGLLVNPQAGETIWDVACGKGGKLGHLCELAAEDTTIIGIEKSPQQIEKAEKTMLRLGHSKVKFVCDDFLEYKAEHPPHKILLDAPCSGLGILRRHPEGKWQKKPDLINIMAKIQRQLIEKSLRDLAVGGELIYSVCSFEPEETIDHLHWLKSTFPDQIEIIPATSRLPDYYKKYVTRDNILLVFSGNQDEMDGFGAFIIKKTK